MRGTQDDPHAAGSGPTAEVSERPEQNVGYDEAAKGAPLTEAERRRAEAESPVAPEGARPPDDDPLLGDE